MGFLPFFTFVESIDKSRGAHLDLVRIAVDKLGIDRLQLVHEANFSLTFMKVKDILCLEDPCSISGLGCREFG